MPLPNPPCPIRLPERLLCMGAMVIGLAACCGFAADARVGDTNAKPVPAKFDANYPDMKEWADAGVRGGIPARMAEKVVKTLKPGDDIQSALDAAGKSGGGVVVLSTGVYPVSKPIDLRSGVVLRGEEKSGSVLECTMRSNKPDDQVYTVRFFDVKKAGLEDLTIRNGAVAKLGLGVYAERVAGPKNNVKGISDLFVGGVQMQGAEDCWIDNCILFHSGADPLNAQGVHLTVRDTIIDGAFNKGQEGGPAGTGNVYFAVDHGLMYNVTVLETRHALVMRDTLSGRPCKFNVILDCTFVGDVNFHGNRQDQGHNLFEGDLVHSPPSHGWPAWSYWKRIDIGPDNLVYQSIGWGGPGAGAYAAPDPTKVYTYTGIRDPNMLGVIDKPAPKGGTLYATTASRPNRLDAGAWPKTAADAMKRLQARLPANRLRFLGK